MLASVFESAAYLCKSSSWKLTNLQVQKMLFFGQMISLGKHEQELLIEDFLAWHYGPVNAELYNDIKIYGAAPIGNIPSSKGISPVGLQRSILDTTFRNFGEMTSIDLIQLTHWKYGAWSKYYSPNDKTIVIPKKAIRDEYHERAKRFEARHND